MHKRELTLLEAISELKSDTENLAGVQILMGEALMPANLYSTTTWENVKIIAALPKEDIDGDSYDANDLEWTIIMPEKLMYDNIIDRNFVIEGRPDILIQREFQTPEVLYALDKAAFHFSKNV